jgi:hypothetical protein
LLVFKESAGAFQLLLAARHATHSFADEFLELLNCLRDRDGDVDGLSSQIPSSVNVCCGVVWDSDVKCDWIWMLIGKDILRNEN